MTGGAGTAPRSAPEWAARHGRLLVGAGLALAAGLGLWLTFAAGDRLMSAAAPPPASIAYAMLLFIMWWAMMMAMMLPSALPALLGFSAISRKIPGQGAAALPAFAAGYAAVWTAFSAAAMVLQIVTTRVVPLTGMMAVASAAIGGGLLAAAGAYQLTPLKDACLRQCQQPVFFLARRWRNGAAGAFRLGLGHGVHCLGCCWVLMLLLFYGGVMELTWIVGLAVYVAAEKLIPARLRFDRAAGFALLLWGAFVLAGALG